MVIQSPEVNKKRSENKMLGNEVTGSIGIKHERKHRLKQRFEVKRKLGQGTYGKVQLAINKETGQEVAIKTIKKSKIENEQDLMRIRREIQIMSSIQHPHIIHIFEVFENKDKIVLVMQYASGGELYEYVSERKVLNDNEARRIFRQIATAVYYCHKNKVCHRDLKLENILLDEKGNAKIGDFGLSNVFDKRHFLNTFCGSPLYASPEIVRGTPYYGPEVDCWSLGVLLYTLVYGAMPFDGSNFKRLVKQISEASYYEPKQKSDASSLIKRLLAVNPAKRATIIDICTDWWVNKGFEHTLLQVAEDLANLTPVRLDLLLALAPVSPSPSTADENCLAGTDKDFLQAAKEQELLQQKQQIDESRKKKSKAKRTDLSDEQIHGDSSTEISTELSTTDITTCAEEEDETRSFSTTANNSTTEFLSASVAAALDEQYRADQEHQQQQQQASINVNQAASNIGKRQASTSFDQSVTRIPSQVQKKKKSKKNSNEQQNELANDDEEKLSQLAEYQSSGYASETTTLSSKDGKDKNNKQQQPVTGNRLSSLANENISELGPISEFKGQKDGSISSEIGVANTVPQNDLSVINIARVNSCDKKLSSPSVSKSSTVNASKEDNIPASLTSVAAKTATTKTPETDKNIPNTISTSSTKAIDITQAKTDELNKEKQIQSSASINENIIETDLNENKQDTTPSTPNEQSRKPSLDRKNSLTARKVGKVSIPKFIEQSVNKELAEKKPVPCYGSVSDARRAFQKRTESFEKSKEKLVPTVKIGDVKRAFERRTSLPVTQVNAPLWKNAGERRQSEANKETSSSQKLIDKLNECDKQPLESPKKVLNVIEKSDNNENIEKSNSNNKCLTTEIESTVNKEQIEKEKSKKETLRSVAEIKLIGKNEPLKEKSDDEQTATAKQTPTPQTSQETESAPQTPEVQPLKAAPITRSYKKVTFTKDGACITETGKIISETGTDGSITRVEKKSKVTHYPSGSGAGAGGAENVLRRTEMKTTKTNRGAGVSKSSFEESSTPPVTTVKPTLRKSESASSSGSTDIFDDIFDTWTGDAAFNSLSNRLKSIFQNRSPFGSLLRTHAKKMRRKIRTESCDRSPGEFPSEAPPFRQFQTSTGDRESDAENEFDSGFSNDLWRFLGPTSPQASKIIERHRSLLQRNLNSPSSIFQDDPFVAFNRSISRDRGTPRVNQTAFNVSINQPSTTNVTRKIVTTKQESFESSDSTEIASTSTTPVASTGTTKQIIRPYGRTWTRELSEPKTVVIEEEPVEASSRKRVEQWLDMNKQDSVDENHPVSLYGTIRPRIINKFTRASSSRLFNEPTEAGSNMRFNTTQEYQVGGGEQGRNTSHGFTETIELPLPRTFSSSSSRPVHRQLRLSLGNFGSTSASPSLASIMSIATQPPAMHTSVSELSDSLDELSLPESSSLLDQLRTHGYKNLVTQRLQGSNILGEQKYNPNENTASGQYKRGKSILKDSSSTRMQMNGACNGANNCVKNDNVNTINSKQCMWRAANINDNTINSNDNMIEDDKDDIPVAISCKTNISSDVCSLKMNKKQMINTNNCAEEKQLFVTSELNATGVHSSESNVLQAKHAEFTKADLISNQSSNTLNRSVTNCPNIDSTTTTKETVQERILRKSFYSRFNDDRPARSVSRTRRRSSLLGGEDFEFFSDFGSSSCSSSLLASRSPSFNKILNNNSSSMHLPPRPLMNGNFFLQRRQPANSNAFLSPDDMFERMQVNANRFFDNMRRQHENIFEPSAIIGNNLHNNNHNQNNNNSNNSNLSNGRLSRNNSSQLKQCQINFEVLS